MNPIAEYVPLEPISGVTDNVGSLADFLNNLFLFGIAIAAGLALIMITLGGIQYMTTDSVSGKSEGKDRIFSAVGGLILLLIAVLIIETINPTILNVIGTDTYVPEEERAIVEGSACWSAQWKKPGITSYVHNPSIIDIGQADGLLPPGVSGDGPTNVFQDSGIELRRIRVYRGADGAQQCQNECSAGADEAAGEVRWCASHDTEPSPKVPPTPTDLAACYADAVETTPRHFDTYADTDACVAACQNICIGDAGFGEPSKGCTISSLTINYCTTDPHPPSPNNLSI